MVHGLRAGRGAILALVVAALALSLGGRVPDGSEARREVVGFATGAVSVPIRALDVVLRADDSDDGGLARTADRAEPLSYLAPAALGMILAMSRPRRAVSVVGPRVRSRSPGRHAVALRAPPHPLPI